MARWRKQAESRTVKRMGKHGPRGHPLQRVGEQTISDPIDFPLPEPMIHELLGQWTDCRSRDPPQQERADAILFELSLHGVRIDVTSLKRTTDPDHVFRKTDSQKKNTSDNAHLQFREDTSRSHLGSTAEEDMKTRQRIIHLIHRRIEAKMTGSREEKIFIEWELRRCYGVRLDDTNLTWYVKTRKRENGDRDNCALLQELLQEHDLRPIEISDVCSLPLVFYQNTSIWNSPAYAKSASSLDLHPAIANRVRSLVQERIHKREESKYVEANAIRRELWDVYVSTNDELM